MVLGAAVLGSAGLSAHQSCLPDPVQVAQCSVCCFSSCCCSEDDEEIPSEEEEEEEEAGGGETRKGPPKRKLDMEEYPEFMAKRFADFRTYRNSTLQKWHDKTKLSSGKMGKARTRPEPQGSFQKV